MNIKLMFRLGLAIVKLVAKPNETEIKQCFISAIVYVK